MKRCNTNTKKATKTKERHKNAKIRSRLKSALTYLVNRQSLPELRRDLVRMDKTEDILNSDRANIESKLASEGRNSTLLTPPHQISRFSTSSSSSYSNTPSRARSRHRYRNALTDLTTHFSTTTSCVSIPSAFTDYSSSSRGIDARRRLSGMQVVDNMEDEVPVPPIGAESERAASSGRADNNTYAARAPAERKDQEVKQQLQTEARSTMRLRSESIDSLRAPAHREPRRGSIPSEHKNSDPDWVKLKRALGHEGEFSDCAALQPTGGWDLESTRLAITHAHYCIIGNECVLHHPECWQLRGFMQVFAHNTYVVPPRIVNIEDLGFRYPAQGACCHGLWGANRGE